MVKGSRLPRSRERGLLLRVDSTWVTVRSRSVGVKCCGTLTRRSPVRRPSFLQSAGQLSLLLRGQRSGGTVARRRDSVIHYFTVERLHMRMPGFSGELSVYDTANLYHGAARTSGLPTSVSPAETAGECYARCQDAVNHCALLCMLQFPFDPGGYPFCIAHCVFDGDACKAGCPPNPPSTPPPCPKCCETDARGKCTKCVGRNQACP